MTTPDLQTNTAVSTEGGAAALAAHVAVDQAIKEPVISCEQCGSCSSACPVTGVDGFNIRRIERSVQLEVIDDLVDSKVPWVCLMCGRCETACPNGYHIMTTTRGLRRLTAPAYVPTMAPCREACPVQMDVPTYVRMIADGKAADAYAVILEKVPLPAVLGRVCAHPCEEACRRKDAGGAISICALKRYAADTAAPIAAAGASAGTLGTEVAQAIAAAAPDTGRRVAVVGSGPAGLTAAFYLRKQGHAVTVFEARPRTGGMLRYGIPAYRLPDAVLDHEIGAIEALGVEIKTGIALAPGAGCEVPAGAAATGSQGAGATVTVESLKADGYDAVFLGVGAQVSRKIKLENAEHPDVLWGVEFLADIRDGVDVPVRDRVVVVGGGNVAVDVALTALRAGAKSVAMACLEARHEMPAFEWELEEAVAEGVELVPSWGPSRVLVEDGKIAGLELVRCRSVFDDSGAFCPMFGDDKRTLEADQVILAIGQATDLSFAGAGSGLQTLGGLLDVDLGTQQTALDGVFAGGDAAAKAPGTPGTIIQAIASARRAAAAIDRYLGGDGDIDERLWTDDPSFVYTGERAEGFADMARVADPTLPVAERFPGFHEVALGFDAESAVREARRCLNCDLEIKLALNGGAAHEGNGGGSYPAAGAAGAGPIGQP